MERIALRAKRELVFCLENYLLNGGELEEGATPFNFDTRRIRQ